MAEIDIQFATDSGQFLPSEALFNEWANAALEAAEAPEDSELSVRIVDDAESRDLNHQYRGKNSPTNVLSFPAEFPEGIDCPLLGDIVICSQVVNREAAEQNKANHAHWAHMTVHGVLHLLGHDHIDEADAEAMERLETSILVKLGFNAPYTPSENQ